VKTLTAVYDLEIGPVSFDFVVWLVKAELERIRVKAEKLHAVIVPFSGGVSGMFRDKTALYDAAEMHWRLWNIVIPACQLINASVSLVPDWDSASRIVGTGRVWPPDWQDQTLRNRHHLIGGLISAAKSGTPIPILKASEHARRAVKKLWGDKPVVTMTARRTYLGDRNSDPVEWGRAKSDIEAMGFTVQPISDVSAALERGSGFAEFSLDLRLAMYEQAVFNIQANNGAASLCWFSHKPYCMFDAGIGDTREEWRGLFEDQGLPWGESWPWASRGQRIVYERSTHKTIMAEFGKWVGATN